MMAVLMLAYRSGAERQCAQLALEGVSMTVRGQACDAAVLGEHLNDLVRTESHQILVDRCISI
jgi:hypothetical protein